LTHNGTDLNEELKQQIIDLCSHTAGSSQVTAIGLVDNYPSKTPNAKSILEIIIIIKDFPPRLMSYFKNINGRNVIIFAIDQWVFERDIDRGFLGEAIASKIIFPYSSLKGKHYLHNEEVALKKRLILEQLENLSTSYPELAYHMQIKPQFFLYEVMLNRIRVFPLLAYELSNLLEGCCIKNEEEALTSYTEALRQLEAEGKINKINGYVTISKKLAAQSQNPKVWLTNLSKNAPRTLFSSFFGVFPQLLNLIAQNTEAFIKTQKINLKMQTDINPNCYAIDPQKYVFVPTSKGLVSLADKVDIAGFAQKMFLNGKPANITLKPIGGVLNDIYLINAKTNGTEKKVLVKRFKEWSGFKWFPLTLWSFGARSFAVSGKARLAKECATSEFLRLRGFNVPKILHVSNAERLIFMEYIEGEDLSQAIKRIGLETELQKISNELEKIEKVGAIFAQVHAQGMTLGDTKPENVMVGKDDTMYLLDFEQATEDGDKAWDIAEFLYYAGHYLQPMYSNGKAESIAESFIKGYIKSGGDLREVKKAAAPKYTRVFSVFTMPSIIVSMANTCKNIKPQGK
jgi:tRNA A-37 threonylcarbamoyl transferase component Bud32